MIEVNLLLSNSYWVRMQYDKYPTGFSFSTNLFDEPLGGTRNKCEAKCEKQVKYLSYCTRKSWDNYFIASTETNLRGLSSFIILSLCLYLILIKYFLKVKVHLIFSSCLANTGANKLFSIFKVNKCWLYKIFPMVGEFLYILLHPYLN